MVDHDDVVKTFSSNRPHDSLADRVRLGRPWRRSHSRDPQIGQPFVEVAAIIRISIVDHETESYR